MKVIDIHYHSLTKHKTMSNLTSNISIRKKHLKDYKEMRRWLAEEGISQGEYLVNNYIEHDQGVENNTRLREIRLAR